MLRFVSIIAATTFALSSLALGEVTDWRSQTHPIMLPYDTELWSVTIDRPKVLPDVFFALKHRDQKTRVFLRLLDLAEGEKLDEKGIATFAEGFRHTSGNNVTFEWTRKDFTTEAGCEFKIVRTPDTANEFMVGRLTSHDGIMYAIFAQGIGSSAEAQESAVKVMRAFKYNPEIPLSGRNREWKSPLYPIVLPYDNNSWAITDARPQGLSDVLVAIGHRDSKTGIFVKVSALRPGEKWDDASLENLGKAIAGGPKGDPSAKVEWIRKDFTGKQGCEFRFTPPKVPGVQLAGRFCFQNGLLYQVIAHGHNSGAEAWDNALEVLHAFQMR